MSHNVERRSLWKFVRHGEKRLHIAMALIISCVFIFMNALNIETIEHGAKVSVGLLQAVQQKKGRV